MIEIKIKPFIDGMDLLTQWSNVIHHKVLNAKVSEKLRSEFSAQLDPLIVELEAAEYEMCRLGAVRLQHDLARTDEAAQIVSTVDDLRRRLIDQAQSFFCLTMSKKERDLYSPDAPLFGADVEAKFPAMSEDIAEAGKCFALDRSTAAVFHLMRVMELAVRKLGDELSGALADEKNWQNILDEVNKAIKALDHKLPRTKALAGAASHLYAVKVAWRNEVMHPKETYTPEQAKAIFDGVRVFVADLAALL